MEFERVVKLRLAFMYNPFIIDRVTFCLVFRNTHKYYTFIHYSLFDTLFLCKLLCNSVCINNTIQ